MSSLDRILDLVSKFTNTVTALDGKVEFLSERIDSHIQAHKEAKIEKRENRRDELWIARFIAWIIFAIYMGLMTAKEMELF